LKKKLTKKSGEEVVTSLRHPRNSPGQTHGHAKRQKRDEEKKGRRDNKERI